MHVIRLRYDSRFHVPYLNDPTFEGVWCDVLSWLQEDPDAKAIALLNRLKSAYPDRFSDTHLRTLQRRVQQWRGIMSKELVYAAAGEPMAGLPAMPKLALVGADPDAKVSVTFSGEATGTGRMLDAGHPLRMSKPRRQVLLKTSYDCVVVPGGFGEKPLHRPG